MKKVKLYVVCLMMLCMAACGNQEAGNGGEFMVKIVNTASDDIYGLEYTCYVNGNMISSGGACNADNSVIKNGETFILQELPTAEEFEVEVLVIDENGKPYDCVSKADIKRGETYSFQITGDFENGFDLIRGDE